MYVRDGESLNYQKRRGEDNVVYLYPGVIVNFSDSLAIPWLKAVFAIFLGTQKTWLK